MCYKSCKLLYILFIFTIISCDLFEGPAGLNTLVNLQTEISGANCVTGGIRIESGTDSNRNNILDPDEVGQVKYVCNGANGTLTMAETEAAGSNCPTGGIRIKSGTDSNRNNILDPDEVVQVKYVCNGANGTLTVVETEAAGSKCTYGGYKLTSGTDLNFNLVLESTEIKTTDYVCNAGSDKQVRIPFPSGASTRSTTYVITDQNTPTSQYLVKFNKLNYADVKSIKFGATLTSGIDPMYPGENNTAYVELFNVTDNVTVSNSELQLTANGSTTATFLESADMYNSLPAKEIQLIMRVKTSNSHHTCAVNTAHMFIYRN